MSLETGVSSRGGDFSAIETPEMFAERALAFLDSIDTREAAHQKD